MIKKTTNIFLKAVAKAKLYILNSFQRGFSYTKYIVECRVVGRLNKEIFGSTQYGIAISLDGMAYARRLQSCRMGHRANVPPTTHSNPNIFRKLTADTGKLFEDSRSKPCWRKKKDLSFCSISGSLVQITNY